MSLLLSFFSGIVASFTPCVIVLIPLLLYRFFHEKEKHFTLFGIFTLGFLTSYFIFAYLLVELLSSQIQNGVKVSLGLLFVVLGILALMGKFNPMNLPLLKNPFLLGSSFALLISFNPCTIPYFSFILGLSSQGEIIINLLAFAFGLLVPSVLFAFLGSSFISFTQKSGKYFDKIKHSMNFLLILSGLYILYTIKEFTHYDSYVISAMILFIFYLLMKSFFIIYSYKELIKLENLLTILALLILFISISLHCSYTLSTPTASEIFSFETLETQTHNQEYSCQGNVSECEVCMRCLYLFLGAFIISSIAFFLRYKNRVLN